LDNCQAISLKQSSVHKDVKYEMYFRLRAVFTFNFQFLLHLQWLGEFTRKHISECLLQEILPTGNLVDGYYYCFIHLIDILIYIKVIAIILVIV